jgi:hypothetical protein
MSTTNMLVTGTTKTATGRPPNTNAAAGQLWSRCTAGTTLSKSCNDRSRHAAATTPQHSFRQLKDHPAQPTTPATCGITGASARLLQVLHVHGPFVALCISLAGTASNCTVAAQPSTDLYLWRPSTDWLSACFILEILHCSAVACCGDWCGDWTARLGRPPQLSSGHALSGKYVLRTFVPPSKATGVVWLSFLCLLLPLHRPLHQLCVVVVRTRPCSQQVTGTDRQTNSKLSALMAAVRSWLQVQPCKAQELGRPPLRQGSHVVTAAACLSKTILPQTSDWYRDVSFVLTICHAANPGRPACHKSASVLGHAANPG